MLGDKKIEKPLIILKTRSFMGDPSKPNAPYRDDIQR